MIKFNLECECGQTFESWFASSGEYTSLRKKNLLVVSRGIDKKCKEIEHESH